MTRANPKTRDKIVQAATTLFARYGFKRASLDAIAAEAEVAKPTVYAYFSSKEDLFTAVAEALCDRILRVARAASEEETALEDQLTAMLVAKHTHYWSLVHSSPHAQELIDTKNALGAEAVARFDRAYLALVTSVLGSSELDLRPRPIDAARLLIRATSGAAYDATTEAMHARAVGEITRAVVAGWRAGRAPTGSARRGQ